MANSRETNKRAASAALEILRGSGTAPLQRKVLPEAVYSRAASAAVKILRDGSYSKPTKTSVDPPVASMVASPAEANGPAKFGR
uniref:Uncharacterized protein n=1 Tax=Candidatus Kentrum sp. LPFa TaxID=2126335 RepID=A0A450X561_9GAMM|nr:MAG: hypothetical protein BECKLPF1236B_GA0070989_14092 [Candidatus Kentron sp. LPFa]